MSAKRLHYMPFFTQDWLSDLHVRAMSAEARGAYIDLIALAWQDGPLPGDVATLARITGAREATIRREVIPRFSALADGTLRHAKIERLRTEQAKTAAERAAHAAKAAAARWGQPAEHAPGMPDALPGHSPGICPAMPSKAKAESEAEGTLTPPLPPPPSAGGARVRDGSRAGPNGTAPTRVGGRTAGRVVRCRRRCHRCTEGRRPDGRCCGCRLGRRRASAWRVKSQDARDHADFKAAGRLPRGAKGGMTTVGAEIARLRAGGGA